MSDDVMSAEEARRLLDGKRSELYGRDGEGNDITGIADTGDVTPGRWRLVMDSCDCGGGYPCSHDDWPFSIEAVENGTRVRDVCQFDGFDGSEADARLFEASKELAQSVIDLHAQLAHERDQRSELEREAQRLREIVDAHVEGDSVTFRMSFISKTADGHALLITGPTDREQDMANMAADAWQAVDAIASDLAARDLADLRARVSELAGRAKDLLRRLEPFGDVLWPEHGSLVRELAALPDNHSPSPIVGAETEEGAQDTPPGARAVGAGHGPAAPSSGWEQS